MTDETTSGADCGGCTLRDALDAPAAMERREFLRAAATVVASLGLFGGVTRSASAMPLPGVALPLGTVGSDAHSEKRYAIPATDSVAIDKDNSIILARAAGKVYAFSLSCPHQNTALRWNADDHEFQCPKHKSHYKPDGVFIEGRATRNMDRMAIRRDGNAIVVDVDLLIQEDERPREWGLAYVTV
jgi:Rieske Fe-S protein